MYIYLVVLVWANVESGVFFVDVPVSWASDVLQKQLGAVVTQVESRVVD